MMINMYWYDLFMSFLIITMNQVLITIFFEKMINLVNLTKIQSALCWLFILQWLHLLVLWHTALKYINGHTALKCVNCNKNSDKNFVKNLINFNDLENKKLTSNHKFYMLSQIFFLSNFMFDKIADKFDYNRIYTAAYFNDFKSKMLNLKHTSNTYCYEKLNCDKHWIFKHDGFKHDGLWVFMKLTNFYVKHIKFCITHKLWPKKSCKNTFVFIFVLNFIIKTLALIYPSYLGKFIFHSICT